jgi:hypothetical protein
MSVRWSVHWRSPVSPNDETPSIFNGPRSDPPPWREFCHGGGGRVKLKPISDQRSHASDGFSQSDHLHAGTVGHFRTMGQ